MLLLRALLLTAISVLLATSAEGRKGFGPGEQEYGFVDIRKEVHMFYWLYYTSATPAYTKRPLVMWLQGGPGGSSTSYGNFWGIGPLTPDFKPRNTTWVQHFNVLFVDNPIGTGYSYLDKWEPTKLLATSNLQIARDLVELMRGFLKEHPTFQTVPFYVFGDGYGGKMGVEFALELEKERKSGKIKVDLQGVAFGNPWISPVDAVDSWPLFLQQNGFLDQAGYKHVQFFTNATKLQIQTGKLSDATLTWIRTKSILAMDTGNINFNNIMVPVKRGRDRSNASQSGGRCLPDGETSDADASLGIMDSTVRFAFGNTIPSSVRHDEHAGAVFGYLYGDFMKPVTDVVEQLLNTTTLQVVFYSGQLDLVAPTPGTIAWMDRLKWPMAEFWNKEAKRQELVVNGIVEGFVKQVKNLSLFWINRAGHEVPADNPAATLEMLRIVTKFDKM